MRHLPFVMFGLAATFVVVMVLTGCTTTQQPCRACIGPYDMGLSSHREAVLLP